MTHPDNVFSLVLRDNYGPNTSVSRRTAVGFRPTLCLKFISEQAKQSKTKEYGQWHLILRISYQNYIVLTVGSLKPTGLEQMSSQNPLRPKYILFNLKKCHDSTTSKASNSLGLSSHPLYHKDRIKHYRIKRTKKWRAS